MADFTSAGNYEPGAEIYPLKKHTTAITKGDVLSVDGTSKGYKTAPATNALLGPFGIATHSHVASAPTASVGKRGIFYVVADGAIDPNDLVSPAGTGGTAGRVVKYVASTVSGTPTQAEVIAAGNDHRRIVGQYLGKLDENPETPTAAEEGDVIRILVGGNN